MYIHYKLFFQQPAGRLWVFSIMFFIIGCTKQNIPKPIVVDPTPVVPKEYYEALREYKKSDHPIMFGWVGGLGGTTPAARGNGAWELPDSLDIVSLWGGYPPIGSQNHKDIIDVRNKKGTRFLWCVFGSGVEELIRKNTPDLFNTDIMGAIDAVAKAMNDTITKYQLDGFDLDYEPGFGDYSIFGDSGGSATNDPHTQRLFKALSQYLGPLSGTGKLLIIDGQSDIGIRDYINYFMQQAYGANSAANLQNRMQTYGGAGFPAHKFVPTETYEGYSTSGTGNLEMMSLWNPTQGRKGGAGAYHLEYDFGANPLYPYERIRKCIQLMNPAATP